MVLILGTFCNSSNNNKNAGENWKECNNVKKKPYNYMKILCTFIGNCCG